MFDKVDVLLPDHLEQGFLGAPVDEQVLHCIIRVDGSIFFGRHEAAAYLQYPGRIILDIDTCPRLLLQ